MRWNAMAMVSHQNKYDDGIGGHIATYSSLATLLEVGFNHFFHGSYGDQPGDLIYFQGHASPGVYARAFLEGRLTEEHLNNFRHELRDTPGLSSYPHPWLMKDFWQFPTVSMGLGPINSIYQARSCAISKIAADSSDAAQSLGISGRRRDGRAGIDRRDRRGRCARSSTT
jgi:pyruvate dehydrogenase E1 component